MYIYIICFYLGVHLEYSVRNYGRGKQNVNDFITLQTSSTTSDPEGHWDMNNCQDLLPDKLQVHWEVQGDWVQVQLTGKIREDQYMAFGLSGNQKR